MEIVYEIGIEQTDYNMPRQIPLSLWMHEDRDAIYLRELPHTVRYDYRCMSSEFSRQTGIEMVILDPYKNLGVDPMFDSFFCYTHEDRTDDAILLFREREDNVMTHLYMAPQNIQDLFRMRNYIPPPPDYELLSISACHLFECIPEVRTAAGDTDVSVLFRMESGKLETMLVPRSFLNILGSDFITGQLQSEANEIDLSHTPGTYENYQQAIRRVMNHVKQDEDFSDIGYLCQLFEAIGSVYVPQIVRDNLKDEDLTFV